MTEGGNSENVIAKEVGERLFESYTKEVELPLLQRSPDAWGYMLLPGELLNAVPDPATLGIIIQTLPRHQEIGTRLHIITYTAASIHPDDRYLYYGNLRTKPGLDDMKLENEVQVIQELLLGIRNPRKVLLRDPQPRPLAVVQRYRLHIHYQQFMNDTIKWIQAGFAFANTDIHAWPPSRPTRRK